MNLAALAAPSFSGLRHLDLFDVNMYRDDFLNAMTWCTNLERLSILLHRPRWTPGPGPYAPWLGYFPPTMDIVTPFDVATILSQSPARATLRTLIIEYPRECEFVMWPGNIGDLRALTRLETLVIGGNALFGSYPDEPEWVVTWGTLDFDRLRMRLPLNLQELHVFNLAYRPGDDGRQELQSAVDVLVANDLLEGIVRPLKVVVHEDDPDATSPRFNAASYPSRGGHGGPGAGSRPGSWAEHFFSYQRVPLFSHHGI
ncbi:hypothetical protein QBC39DRAFT_346017 [Podospora conica]|nr:hypothetical protein QBC39DRAFT_346017 [Schizothecium conicum]